MERTEKTDKISFKNSVKRWIGKHFRKYDICNSNCSKCLYCPYITDNKYTFEIKKRDKE